MFGSKLSKAPPVNRAKKIRLEEWSFGIVKWRQKELKRGRIFHKMDRQIEEIDKIMLWRGKGTENEKGGDER